MSRPFVIFDFDGTIADSFVESLAAYNRIAPRLRLRTIQDHELPGLRRMGAGELLRVLGIPMWKLPRLMIAARADLHDHFHSVKPIPGIAEALRDLSEAGCHLAIVTSNSEENVRQFLTRHQIADFQTIVAGSSIFGKATRLRRLVKFARADRATTVYVGDTVPDVRAAREARTFAVAVAWGFNDRAPLEVEVPDALVESTRQLAPMIRRLVATS
jgi:phosphoglycolate phosphatase-like HAD superfamily hydrolase